MTSEILLAALTAVEIRLRDERVACRPANGLAVVGQRLKVPYRRARSREEKAEQRKRGRASR